MLSVVGRLRFCVSLTKSIDNAFVINFFILRGRPTSLGPDPTTSFCQELLFHVLILN